MVEKRNWRNDVQYSSLPTYFLNEVPSPFTSSGQIFTILNEMNIADLTVCRLGCLNPSLHRVSISQSESVDFV